MNPRPPLDPQPLGQRMTEQAEQLRQQAGLAANAERQLLIKQARELDTAVDVQGWLSSPELKPPS
ncbi:hypothetical protein SR870_04480 [Rhodopseudomonas palustris]|uniref:hypothetical protein n=1 Tax=Rhodopseudomonas palustris TaxID=1076 RepID=UPI002ACE59B9|nr:hypothetical protein [Rhodopseudomonas palustris]WQH00556.1 hypothetical protein SR870_04480 [Rhodopseudomonas palustris]